MKSDRFDRTPIASTYGNAAQHDGGKTLAAAAIGTTVDIVELPAGTRITDLKAVHGALGESTTLEVGIRYPNGDGTDDPDYFLAAASSVSAGHRYTSVAPVQFEVPVIITATTRGGEATGRIDVIPTYNYMGPK